MTLDALAQQVLLDLGVTNSQEINAGLVRIALAQAERMGMERAAKLCDRLEDDAFASAGVADQVTECPWPSECAAAIRAEMERL